MGQQKITDYNFYLYICHLLIKNMSSSYYVHNTDLDAVDTMLKKEI